MGMLPSIFWHEFSMADFQRKTLFFYKNKNDEFKDRWHQIRKLAHINALVSGAKVEAEEVVPLPWDKDATKNTIKEKPLTATEGEAMVERYSKLGLFNNKKGK